MWQECKIRLDIQKLIVHAAYDCGIKHKGHSRMSQYFNNLLTWSTDNCMVIKSKKTKEMILGTANKSPPPLLTISNSPVERVTCFKLLGINICNDLRWDAHVDALCSKVASRLYFLKLLKRSGLSADDLLCFYKSVIRSVLEYGSVVWHHHLTLAQSDKLEALQKRAVRIILYPLTLPLSTIYNCPWISKTGVTQTPSNGGW